MKIKLPKDFTFNDVSSVKRVGVALNPLTVKMLDEMAKENGVSRSKMLRAIIMMTYRMNENGGKIIYDR